MMTMVLINGSNVLQAYFAITGYLISTQFAEMKEKHKFTVSIFWKAIIYRYLRYVDRAATVLMCIFKRQRMKIAARYYHHSMQRRERSL